MARALLRIISDLLAMGVVHIAILLVLVGEFVLIVQASRHVLSVWIALLAGLGWAAIVCFGSYWLATPLLRVANGTPAPRSGHCGTCGYCIAGLQSKRCPECGSSF